ncbi:hypothetical protein HY967_03545 [Candidatus Jorgensenbacteria bacterium]|nr:hypothetical protein [Candidatus Jorgensenbacteria bacterium]
MSELSLLWRKLRYIVIYLLLVFIAASFVGCLYGFITDGEVEQSLVITAGFVVAGFMMILGSIVSWQKNQDGPGLLIVAALLLMILFAAVIICGFYSGLWVVGLFR